MFIYANHDHDREYDDDDEEIYRALFHNIKI